MKGHQENYRKNTFIFSKNNDLSSDLYKMFLFPLPFSGFDGW